MPGGFMRIDETIEDCARRELKEETGYEASRLRQFGVFSDTDRDPRERVLTVAFYALVAHASVRGGDDAAEARWFTVTELPPLAFDHDRIVACALEAMRRDVYFDPLGFELLPRQFSMTELQRITEALTGRTYDRRNFYNKMRHQGLVTEVDARPAVMNMEASAPPPNRYEDSDSDDAALCKESCERGRRSGVLYSFNLANFLKRKKDKGGDPPFQF